VDGSAADGDCTNPTHFDHDDGRGSRPFVAFWSFATNLPGAGVSDADAFACLDAQLVSGDGLAGTDGFVPPLTGHDGSCEADVWQIALEDGLGRAAGHLWVGLGSTRGINLFGGLFHVDVAQPIFPVPIQLKGRRSRRLGRAPRPTRRLSAGSRRSVRRRPTASR
jgi:hypothetical protein